MINNVLVKVIFGFGLGFGKLQKVCLALKLLALVLRCVVLLTSMDVCHRAYNRVRLSLALTELALLTIINDNQCIVHRCLQCFNAVGLAAGRASGL